MIQPPTPVEREHQRPQGEQERDRQRGAVAEPGLVVVGVGHGCNDTRRGGAGPAPAASGREFFLADGLGAQATDALTLWGGRTEGGL